MPGFCSSVFLSLIQDPIFHYLYPILPQQLIMNLCIDKKNLTVQLDFGLPVKKHFVPQSSILHHTDHRGTSEMCAQYFAIYPLTHNNYAPPPK